MDHLRATRRRNARRNGRRAIELACFAAALLGTSPLALAQATEGDWPQAQGGPAHLGSTEQGPRPPLRIAWRFDDPHLNAGLSTPVISGDLVVGVSLELVHGFDLATGDRRFGLVRERGPLSTPAVAEGPEGPVLLYAQGKGDHASVAGVDLASGAPIWITPIGRASVSGVTVDGDRAYLGDRSGRVYALDVGTGEIVWTYEDEGDFDAGLAVGSGSVFAPLIRVSDSGADLRLVAIDQDSGEAVWNFAAGPRQTPDGGPLVVGDRVYEGFGDRFVRALEASTGRELWATRLRQGFLTASKGAWTGTDLVVADLLGGLYRLDGETGEQVWDYQFEGLENGIAPVVVGSFVFVGLSSGELVAVDLEDGTQAWQVDTGDGGLGGIAVHADGLVVGKAGRRGGVVAFEPDPGGELTSIPSPTTLDPGPMVLDLALGLLAVLVVAYLAARFVVRPLILRPAEGGSPIQELP